MAKSKEYEQLKKKTLDEINSDIEYYESFYEIRECFHDDEDIKNAWTELLKRRKAVKQIVKSIKMGEITDINGVPKMYRSSTDVLMAIAKYTDRNFDDVLLDSINR